MDQTRNYWEIFPDSPIVWLAAPVGIVVLWQYWQNRHSIPIYGGILSFSRTLSMIKLAPKGIEESIRAYAKYPIVFLPRGEAWYATAHSKYAEEISRAPDDVLSFLDAASETIQTKYTFGPKLTIDHYHLNVIRNQLTRHLAGLFLDVLDETKKAVANILGKNSKEWTTVAVLPFSQQVVARASNRIFVGLPLCRDEQWIALMIASAKDTMSVAMFVNLFPVILRPLVGWYSSTVKQRIRAATKIAGPTVEKKIAETPDARSDDFTSWLISSAPENERNVHDIISRLVMTNFVAIHTSSMTVTNCLYWLLARPKHIEPLLEEITEITTRLGWSKEAIGAMIKLDSFVKECMRISPFGTQGLSRRVRKPFTFSNGFQAPVGMNVSVHLYATHHDGNIYKDPEVFDGFRFVDSVSEGNTEKEKGETDSGVKKAMYTTSKTFLAFGHGKHACPGRFFAAMEIKLVLAYLIYTYEMKWPDKVYDPSVSGYTEEGYRPPDNCNGYRMTPNSTAEMMIRKRAAA